ncbi:nucleotide sugar dehydrogenase [Desulfonatronovibrio magnus]|uniref:nucleotide sugar dehydrogenase n=1 Tax=Desulfonatronovibrio magnus TaxID=698827 RepID=UPI0005EBB01E|nr:nucleotide sugar dehydrogenase [Desulfonatronovibrio magnus]
MKVSIFGLGYVGTVSAGCLAREGHEVMGVDPVKVKVDMINNGQTPVIEKDIGRLISDGVNNRLIVATQDAELAVQQTDLSLICVGTPSMANGSLDLSYIESVCRQIGMALKNKEEYHVVTVRSTMLPGSMRKVVIPVLEEFSGKKAETDFAVCVNPEFLREGSAVHDYFNPPKTVIGEMDSTSGEQLMLLYENIAAPMVRVDLETAEMIKYTDNVWHALKIVFANEVGSICQSLNLDPHEVMEKFCMDTKLNISSAYLKPGFAFGGSCLPKDVRALCYKARSLDLDLPVISNIIASNKALVDRKLNDILALGQKRVGILGFSFKTGTDDLRESPVVEIIERLIGKGFSIKLYDKNVNIASLMGANRDYILNKIPHISRLMVTTISGVLDHAQVVVLGNNDPDFSQVPEMLSIDQVLIDLSGAAVAGSPDWGNVKHHVPMLSHAQDVQLQSL